MKIVQATKKDYKEVNSLLVKLHNFHAENCPETFIKTDIFFEKRFYNKRLKNGYIYFLAKEDEKIVGIIGINTCSNDFIKILSVNSLYVEKEYRNKGIATKLFNKVKKYFNENCNDSTWCDCLSLNVSSFNKTAISFYENLGFKFQSHNMDLKLK